MTFEEYCVSKKNLFAFLARYYGWTFSQIEEMTPEQTKIAYDSIPDKEPENTGVPGSDGNLHFSTLEEWRAWMELH